MTKLMVWASLFGALVGTVVLGAMGVSFYATHRDEALYYEGSVIEFPEGDTGGGAVDLTPFFGDASSWWTQMWLPWWTFPLIGAVTAAVLSAPFAIAGVRLGRPRQ